MAGQVVAGPIRLLLRWRSRPAGLSLVDAEPGLGAELQLQMLKRMGGKAGGMAIRRAAGVRQECPVGREQPERMATATTPAALVQAVAVGRTREPAEPGLPVVSRAAGVQAAAVAHRPAVRAA